MRLPKFEPAEQGKASLELNLQFLKFRRSETEFDWNYPFDFCGAIYRIASVTEVIDKI